VNTATTAAAIAEAMADQSVAFSDKANVCKLSMMDWSPEETIHSMPTGATSTRLRSGAETKLDAAIIIFPSLN
jgi:hypothetical protein